MTMLLRVLILIAVLVLVLLSWYLAVHLKTWQKKYQLSQFRVLLFWLLDAVLWALALILIFML